MEKIVSILQNYNEILTEAFVALMSLILIIFLARILRQIKRLNLSLTSITNTLLLPAFAADFPPNAHKFNQRTIQVRLINLCTFYKKSFCKIRRKETPRIHLREWRKI